ncbi:MAG TPA: NAD-binding protein, partial [Salinarimonas sp.]|nr:NAD-binding protein [Salinarimonas sp.]
AGARWLVSAIPNPFEASTLIEAGRAANPALRILARAHSDAEVEHLQRHGATQIVLGEREIAREMAARLFGNDPRPSPLEENDLAPDGDAFENARRKLA